MNTLKKVKSSATSNTVNIKLTVSEIQICCDNLAGVLSCDMNTSTDSDEYAVIITEWRQQRSENKHQKVLSGWSEKDAEEADRNQKAAAALLEKLVEFLPEVEAEAVK